MKSFITEVVDDVLTKHQNIENITFILPSKRAGTFLKNEIRKASKKTSFAPEIYSIEDFVQELANLKLAPNIQLLFEFYEVYKHVTTEKEIEDFYSFSKWAQIILQDFNEIDRYLIDPNQVFSYLSSIKELHHWSLDPNKTELQKNYLKFWEVLHTYYFKFKERLQGKQMGYQGLIYREAIENIEYYLQSNINKKHIFIGFNALNNAEVAIITEFLQSSDADIYWDIDETFFKDPQHDAGLFIRTYKEHWKYFDKNPFKTVSNNFQSEKNIEIVGVPKSVGQAKYAGKLLENLSSTQKKLENTAVVLGNEVLLTPVLNSIPTDIEAVNITSGLPLVNTPIASFFSVLFDHFEKEINGKWYYKDVLNLISHPISRVLLTYKNQDSASNFITTIHKKNIAYVMPAHIKSEFPKEIHNVAGLLFVQKSESSVEKIIQNCISIILLLKEHYADHATRNTVYLEYLYRFYELFNQIDTLNQKYRSITDVRSLKGIYKELVLKETIDFRGEPLEGLQIMGVLESRNLDFETIIITSVNEGILPSGKSNNSFLPFDIKIAFGLPTYKEKDAVYAYHFYRLLQRAKNIYLLYNTEPDALEGGEKSRFIMQLVMQKQANHKIREIIASPKIVNQPTALKVIQKDGLLIERLKEIANKGFSPTSLSNYVRNPIDFYYQSVLGIRTLDEVEETVAANTLGTIVHNTLEEFYKPLESKMLTMEAIENMKLKVGDTVTHYFDSEYKGGNYSKGKNLISFHVAKRYVENFLKFDENRLKEGKNIKIIEIESDLKTEIAIPGLDFPIFLRGKVDRVEEVNGRIHIIDYKTGKVQQNDVEIISWEDLTADYKYSKAFQVLCYAFMINAKNAFEPKEAEVGIISFKNLSGGFLKFAKKDRSGQGAVKETIISKDILENYKTELKKLVLEIFDPAIPLTEKELETFDY